MRVILSFFGQIYKSCNILLDKF